MSTGRASDGLSPDSDLTSLAAGQAGMLSRPQVLAHGRSDEWIEHRLGSRRWQHVHAGVYATFTGPLPWESRCWAALLRAGTGAALAGETALCLWAPRSLPNDGDVVVAVDKSRRVVAPDGVDLWRVTNLKRHVHPARTPRRLRMESAVLMTAARRDNPDDAIGVVADACQSHRTTPERLRDMLASLPTTMRHRRLLTDILDDVSTGAYSYLEVRYLRGVERPHALPTGRRQRRVVQGRAVCFRDVEYVGYDVVVELDGRLGHEKYADRAADIVRDAGAAQAGKITTRAGYRQVLSDTCGTAQGVAELLRARGWSGRLARCGLNCSVR